MADKKAQGHDWELPSLRPSRMFGRQIGLSELTFPARGKAQVLHPGRQAGQGLAVRLGRAGRLQLARHDLHAQRLAHLWVLPAARAHYATAYDMPRPAAFVA